MHRTKVGNSIFVNLEDVEAGFRLYNAVSEANERGLSPELYEIYQKIKPQVTNEGITTTQFQKIYYQSFHKPIGSKRAREILKSLCSVDLFNEITDLTDKRIKRFQLSEIYSPQGGGKQTNVSPLRMNTLDN